MPTFACLAISVRIQRLNDQCFTSLDAYFGTNPENLVATVFLNCLRGCNHIGSALAVYIAKHTKVDMLWALVVSPHWFHIAKRGVAMNLKATTLTYLAIVISNKFATFAFTCKPCPGAGYSDDQCLKVLHNHLSKVTASKLPLNSMGAMKSLWCLRRPEDFLVGTAVPDALHKSFFPVSPNYKKVDMI